MPEKYAKAAENTVHVAEMFITVVLAICIVVGLGSQFWVSEGRSVIRFGEFHDIYVEPSRPGEGTVVHMPLKVERSCIPIESTSLMRVQQGETDLVSSFDGGLLTAAPLKGWQEEFEFPLLVPDQLAPGEAVFHWTLLWDCGLRKVRTTTPQAMMEILPPVR